MVTDRWGANLLCIVTLVLWHGKVVARVSFRLLGLSDDEPGPTVPTCAILVGSSESAFTSHTLWGWKLLLHSPPLPL